MLDKDEAVEAMVVIEEQTRRIAEVVKRLREIERERSAMSVEYLGEARMIDLHADGRAGKGTGTGTGTGTSTGTGTGRDAEKGTGK